MMIKLDSVKGKEIKKNITVAWECFTIKYPVFMWGSYALVVILYIILDIFSRRENANGWVTNIMLLLVLASYIYLTFKFNLAREIEKDLKAASKKIREDHENYSGLLWDVYYSDKNDALFSVDILNEKYYAYIHEMKRLKKESDDFKCDISGYISKELIDANIKKYIWSLIPGTLTGLGILGTFIGLSFGLKSFNTGNAEEIEKSIAPLMAGIKVAFHTSIYGMVLSLFFNFIYKGQLDEVYRALEDFWECYECYVVGNAENDNSSKLQSILNGIPGQVAEKFSEVVSPVFERMSDVLENLAGNMSDRQVEGVNNIVNDFIAEMNKSLGNHFDELGKTIEETCKLQEANGEYMQNILSKIGDMTQNITDINTISGQTVNSLAEYISEIEKLQKIINENFMSVNLQLDEHNEAQEKLHSYVAELTAYEKQITEAAEKYEHAVVEQLQLFDQYGESLTYASKKNLEMLATAASSINKTMSDSAVEQMKAISQFTETTSADMDSAAKKLYEASRQYNGQLQYAIDSTFEEFDKNLAEISLHLSGTILEINEATGRVPKVVDTAYEGMEKTLRNLQCEMNALVDIMKSMEKELLRTSEEISKRESKIAEEENGQWQGV